MNIHPFHSGDELPLIRLWEECGLVVSWNNPQQDIRRKIECQADGLLLGWFESKLASSVMAGYEGHRGWINYLAVSPDFRHLGLGRKMMGAAEAYLRKFGCPKINLQVRKENNKVIGFYQHVGYREDPVVSLSKRLAIDEH